MEHIIKHEVNVYDGLKEYTATCSCGWQDYYAYTEREVADNRAGDHKIAMYGYAE